MSYEKVAQAKAIVIGTKQTLKALKEKQAQEVILASDTDYQLIRLIKAKANELNVSVTEVDSMKKLGKACGIEVSAATVAIIK